MPVFKVIEAFPEYTIYHYGQYETRFLERMKERGGEEDGAAIDRVLTSSRNVLSAIYSHVYFPTTLQRLERRCGTAGVPLVRGRGLGPPGAGLAV